jgi:hypothetical protein
MKRLMVRALTAMVAVVFLPCVVNGQEPQPGPDKPKAPATGAPGPEAKKPDKPNEMSLEEMLNKAFKDNPDIRVAEAKVREAEAELNRARLQVTQKVIALHRALEAQRSLTELAQKNLDQVRRERKANDTDQNFGAMAQNRLAKAKEKLAEIEAELPYLIGNPPVADRKLDFSLSNLHELTPQLQFRPIRRELIELKPFDITLDRRLPINWPFPAGPATGSKVDQLRKDLDKNMKVQFEDALFSEVIERIELTSGIAFRILDTKERDISFQKVTLKLKDSVTIGAALQALEDSFPGLRFIVRDYGVLVTWADKVPPGAMTVGTLWKSAQAQDSKPKAEPPKAK